MLNNFDENDEFYISFDEDENSYGNWYKDKSLDKIWWRDTPNHFGLLLFSFDKKTIFSLFADYPYKLTKEQKLIFDEENPHWKEFFKDRQ